MRRAYFFTVLIGFIVQLVLPLGLGLLAAFVFSTLSLMAPLGSGEVLLDTWSTYGALALVQVLQASLGAVLLVWLLGHASRSIRSGWLYALGFFGGAILHIALCFAFVFVSRSVFPTAGEGVLLVLGVIIALLGGPILGLLASSILRREQQLEANG